MQIKVRRRAFEWKVIRHIRIDFFFHSAVICHGKKKLKKSLQQQQHQQNQDL